MTEILFNSPPDGHVFKNPDLNLFRTLIFHGQSQYWNAGAGQALIELINQGEESLLALTFHQDMGFQVEVKLGDEPYFVCLGNGDFDNTVTVHVGGEPLLLPTKFFVTKQTTWDIVQYFCETGQRNNDYQWASVEELNWHYGRQQ
ncbi:MAG: hypothetical protein HC896_07770 [Bacteroidales bacterium]|nr:hypothetical protein [Bacteroidales bacterium]